MNKRTKKKIEKFKYNRNFNCLIKIADKGKYDERFEALKALGEIGDNSLIPQIIKFIDDKIEMVSLQAIDTIKALNPNKKTNQLIRRKISYWNKYDVRNNKKTNHFNRFSYSSLLYHYRLSTKNKEKKETLKKIIDSNGGYDSVLNKMFQEYTDKIKKFDNLKLIETYKSKDNSDFIEYKRALETEVKNRGGILKLKNQIKLNQKIIEKKRLTLLNYIFLSLLGLLVISFLAIKYYRYQKIRQYNIERNIRLLYVASELESSKFNSFAPDHSDESFNRTFKLKFNSIENWIWIVQQIQKDHYIKNSSYIENFSELKTKISKPKLDSIALKYEMTINMINTINQCFSNNNPDFIIEYTTSDNNSEYRIKAKERVDCNFDNDSDDYFYYSSNNRNNNILFYDKANVRDIERFFQHYKDMLNNEIVSFRNKKE